MEAIKNSNYHSSSDRITRLRMVAQTFINATNDADFHSSGGWRHNPTIVYTKWCPDTLGKPVTANGEIEPTQFCSGCAGKWAPMAVAFANLSLI